MSAEFVALVRRRPMSGTLIVGASQAGVQLAVSLRELGDTAPITLVGAEAYPPYQRPPLSKEFLTGIGAATSRSPSAPPPSTPTPASSWSAASGSWTSPCAADGRPGIGDGPHGDRPGAALRPARPDRRGPAPAADDARAPTSTASSTCATSTTPSSCAPAWPRAARVVVVGGGFIGLEAAAVARAQGKHVTVVEAAERLVPRAVAPVVSEFYRQAHSRRGTDVRLATAVAGFSGRDGSVTGVLLADGTELPADLVMVGVGVLPRTELAEQLGLECDGGIVVDAHARTSEPPWWRPATARSSRIR